MNDSVSESFRVYVVNKGKKTSLGKRLSAAKGNFLLIQYRKFNSQNNFPTERQFSCRSLIICGLLIWRNDYRHTPDHLRKYRNFHIICIMLIESAGALNVIVLELRKIVIARPIRSFVTPADFNEHDADNRGSSGLSGR